MKNIFFTCIFSLFFAALSFAGISPESIELTEYEIVPGDTLAKIAKKFNTTPQFIKDVNRISGDKIYSGRKIKVPVGVFKVEVDKSENKLYLYFNNKVVKVYNVATGRENSTPVGEFKVANKLLNPVWYHDGEVIPAGDPKNELGTRWIGFNLDGYGIHGTIAPESIGKQSTAGCVRMLNSDVEELFDIIPVGAKVLVRD